MNKINSKILGTGSYLPKNIVTNYDLEKRLDTTHDWIVQRTGIHQRHIADSKETVAFMAAEAARQALVAANISKNQIDLIIVASCSGESVFPSAAGSVQKYLEIPACPAFDISVACAGFVYALSVADSFIKTGKTKYALVIGSEAMSRVFDPDDRSIAVLFGDGAGAVLLGANPVPDTEGVIATELYADGNFDSMLTLNQMYPADSKKTDLSSYYIHMDGKEVFKVAVNKLETMVEKIILENGFKKADLNWLVPHQANYRIIKSVAKRLELSEDQVILTVANHANTSAASIPLALDYGVRNSQIKSGDLILLESFGGGLAWGSALIRY
jgi:3-oxoacyl-[acyl-carrier-protein] synthase-3